MANDKLRKWMKENGKTVRDIMNVLRLDSVYKMSNRLNGITEFSPLEKKTLAEYAGLKEDELF